MGAIVMGLFLGFMLGDLFIMECWSRVFDCSSDNALLAYGICVGYIALAFVLSHYKDKAKESYPWPRLVGVHQFASRWMWRLFWYASLAGILAAIFGDLFSWQSTHYVEVIGSWGEHDVLYKDIGADMYSSKSISYRCPILRDVVSGQVFLASDKRGQSDGLMLLLNSERGLMTYRYGLSSKYSVVPVTVKLDRTIFGKNKIVSVTYQDFNSLPPRVQQQTIREGAPSHDIGPTIR